MKNLIFILTLLITFSFCKKNIEIEGDDYLSFGSFNGFCVGNDCVKIYRLEDNKLYEDPNDLNGTLIGYITLSDEKYNQVKDLVDYIPKELFNKNEETFGCPDCADQGGIYVKYFLEGKSGEFRMDANKSANPEYLHEFIDQINSKLDLL